MASNYSTRALRIRLADAHANDDLATVTETEALLDIPAEWRKRVHQAAIDLARTPPDTGTRDDVRATLLILAVRFATGWRPTRVETPTS